MGLRHVAGMLLVFAGTLGVISAMLMFFAGTQSTWKMVAYLNYLSGVLNVMFSIGAFVGAAYSFSGSSFGVAIAGSVMGILSTGPFFSATILSIVALVLVVTAKKEFDEVKYERYLIDTGQAEYVDASQETPSYGAYYEDTYVATQKLYEQDYEQRPPPPH